MWQFLAISILAVVLHSFFSSLAVLLGVSPPLLVSPAILTLAAFFQRASVGLATVAVLGIFLDSVNGQIFGTNIILLFIIWACGVWIAQWIGKPRWLVLIGCTACLSLLYRLLLHLYSWQCCSHSANIGLFEVVFYPLLDGFFGIAFIRLFGKALGIVREVEQ